LYVDWQEVAIQLFCWQEAQPLLLVSGDTQRSVDEEPEEEKTETETHMRGRREYNRYA
jgi:hypothetical protein